MARSPVEALTCDASGCDARLQAPKRTLADEAEAAGWQVAAVVSLAVGDDLDLVTADRCPGHRLPEGQYLRPEDVMERAGGPGGIRPTDLRWPGGVVPEPYSRW